MSEKNSSTTTPPEKTPYLNALDRTTKVAVSQTVRMLRKEPAPPPPTDFTPLMQELAPLLAKGERRINIWDGNHGIAAPLELLASEQLYQLISPYGKPRYLFEDASPGANKAFEELRVMTPEARAAEIERKKAFRSPEPVKYQSYVRLLEMNGVRADVYIPDPRGEAFEKANFTEQELAYWQQSLQLSEPVIRAFLDEQECRDYNSFQKKVVAVATDTGKDLDTTGIDRKIKQNVDAYAAAHHTHGVQVMLYGALHFMKGEDLDEHLPGVSVLVTDRPGGVIQGAYANKLFTDIPDYVWYDDQKRLVKLNTPEAIAELKGERTLIMATVKIGRITPSETQEHSGIILSESSANASDAPVSLTRVAEERAILHDAQLSSEPTERVLGKAVGVAESGIYDRQDRIQEEPKKVAPPPFRCTEEVGTNEDVKTAATPKPEATEEIHVPVQEPYRARSRVTQGNDAGEPITACELGQMTPSCAPQPGNSIRDFNQR